MFASSHSAGPGSVFYWPEAGTSVFVFHCGVGLDHRTVPLKRLPCLLFLYAWASAVLSCLCFQVALHLIGGLQGRRQYATCSCSDFGLQVLCVLVDQAFI